MSNKTFICVAYPVGTDPAKIENNTASKEWIAMNNDIQLITHICVMLRKSGTYGVDVWTIHDGILYHENRDGISHGEVAEKFLKRAI